MAVPKKKTSRSSTRSRRAHFFEAFSSPRSVCSNCGETKEPHRVCLKCGYYNGKKVLEFDDGEE
jgi:large subunit ribosomal protein L32